MKRMVLLVLGAMPGMIMGVLAAWADGIELMIVLGAIGALASLTIGGCLCALVGKSEKRASPRSVPGDRTRFASINTSPVDDKDRLPIAGDPDPVSRAMTGTPDLTRLGDHSF